MRGRLKVTQWAKSNLRLLHHQLTAGRSIEGKDLGDIDWQDRSYDEPVFLNCSFTETRFTSTGLVGGRFTGCRFLRCGFSRADLLEAVFTDCVFVDRTDPPEGCRFAFSGLRSSRFTRCNLSFVEFDRCDLFSVEMDRCNLLGASFSKMDFSHAYSRKIVTTQELFLLCNFELAHLAELRMPFCDLSGSRLR